MNLLSLRTRLLLTHAPVVLAALSILTLFQFRDQQRWVERRAADEMAREATRIAAQMSSHPLALAGRWTEFAARMEGEHDCIVTVLDADGRLLADSRLGEDAAHRRPGLARDPEVAAALAGRVGQALREGEDAGGSFAYAAAPSRVREAAAVRTAQPLSAVHDPRGESLRLLGTGALVTLGFSLALAWLVVGPLANRIQALERVTREIGAGSVTARASESPEDEIGRLGRAINRMSEERRARLEEVQRERDEREQILARMSDGVALVDARGHVIHCNHSLAIVLGAPQPAARGASFREFARIPELDDLLRDARESGEAVEDDLRLWSPRPRLVHATATALGAGESAAVLLVVRDLSEIEQLDRVRQDFVANVSHEMRTPLTSIRGYAETLLEGAFEDHERREGFARAIHDQAVRLERFLKDLLSIAELERPDAQLRLERFDFREFVATQVSGFENRANRAGLSLSLEPGPPLPIEADRSRLEQVVANLIDNAIKYTDRGGVEVRVGGDGTHAWCEVSDTGPGIPEADQGRVFERFYRVDKARSRAKGGTGLGLSIVRQIVEMHRGSVNVSSRPGAGTTFRFELPAAHSSDLSDTSHA